LSALAGTPYGKALLVKLVAVGIVATFAYGNWKTVRPSSEGDVSAEVIARSGRRELIASLVVVIVTALLVALPTPESLAAVIDALWQLPEARLSAMGAAGHQRVESITWDHVIDVLTEALPEIRDLHVICARGEVTLEGVVPDRTTEVEATRLAARIPGVVDLIPRLRVA